MHIEKKEWRDGILLILAAALISGISIFINSYGVKGFDSSVFTFSKNVIVTMFLFAVIIALGKIPELTSLKKKHWLQLALIGLVGGSIPFLLFFKGLQITTGTTSAFIHKTLFIYVTIVAMLFLKDRMTKGMFIGAVLLLAGNYLMLRPSFDAGTGNLLVLAAAILWAAENTLAKHVLKDISGTVVVFGRMFFGSLFTLIFLGMTGNFRGIVHMTGSQYGWILVTAVFLLAYVFCYYNGLKHVKVTTAACILALGSPITTLLSWIAGSAPTFPQGAGVLLILLGVTSVIALSQRLTLKPLSVMTYGRR